MGAVRLIYDSTLSRSTDALINELSTVTLYVKEIRGFTRTVNSNIGITNLVTNNYDSLTSNKSGIICFNGVIQNSVAP